jgi:nicotinamidase-related amidase
MDNTALIIIDMQKDFVGEGENTVVLSHIVDFVVEIGCLLFFVMSCF